MTEVLPAGDPGLRRARPARSSMPASLVRLARPKQWTKNVLVLAAPGAAGVLSHGPAVARVAATFGLFCLVASGTYYLNDALDAEVDRRHPTKRHRPVASGAVPAALAYALGVAMLGAGIGLGALVDWRLSVVLGTYTAVQFAYSYHLKHQPVFDLVAVASGFVLRAIAGGVAVPVVISQWFLLVATFGSLLMVTGKRLAEHTELGQGRGSHRATLDQYSGTFLRTVLAIAAGGGIVCYCLWAFSLQTALRHHADPIWYQLSIVPMIVALLRYTFLVEQGKGANPEDLVLSDHSLQALGVAWVALFALGVYAS